MNTTPSWGDVRALAQSPQECVDAFVRYARNLVQERGDGEALCSSLKDASSFQPELRRHLLVTAAREALMGNEQQHHWIREFGCDSYMESAWDISLISEPKPLHYFAEFLCYTSALLRGQQPAIHNDFLPGGAYAHYATPNKSNLTVDDVIGIWGVHEQELAKHPVLQQWLENARAEPRGVS